MNSLISIIIPTYNRCGLLGATIDSILKQTWSNWECLVIDDGSEDYTLELLNFYCEKDDRIKVHKRPKTLKKGANSCRNFGFQKSQGKYIQWFDSDDLMVPDFLEIKLKTIMEYNADFVISKSENFRDPDFNDILSRNDIYYNFSKFEITNFNYVSHRLNWLTYDFFGKKEFIKGTCFNEDLPSGQERNFFSKLTTKPFKAKVIDKYLTKRRIHDTSIQSKLRLDHKRRRKEENYLNLQTWIEISLLSPGSNSEKFLLDRIIQLDGRRFPSRKVMFILFTKLLSQKRAGLLSWYLLYKIVFGISGKGVALRNLFNKYFE